MLPKIVEFVAIASGFIFCFPFFDDVWFNVGKGTFLKTMGNFGWLMLL